MVYLDELGPYYFTFESWRAGSLMEFGIKTREYFIFLNKSIIKKNAIGYIKGEKLWIRKKPGTYAVMFFNENKGEHFWTHLLKKNLNIVFQNN